jgi:alpha-tubulin suppressor-like RCC1 family protein
MIIKVLFVYLNIIKKINVMKKIEDFINENLNEFSNLSCSEVIEYGVNEFDNETVGYLFKNYRFDYKDICVYLVKNEREIWVENMNS